MGFQRALASILAARLGEPRRFLQVVAGPRQAGKTTLVQQVLAATETPSVYASADEPTLRDAAWLAARSLSLRSCSPPTATSTVAADHRGLTSTTSGLRASGRRACETTVPST
jgi:molybdopterin-guanine dinucleotide biosynthesis protein